MKALILNSGLGSRMGVLTKEHPKCMTSIERIGTEDEETILSRQLRLLTDAGIKDIVITTGKFDTVLMEYCDSLGLPCHITYVKNPIYDQTNYIYSIYMAREVLQDDILLMHGDLVFTKEVLDEAIASKDSCMTVSSTQPLPEKDFKAVIAEPLPDKTQMQKKEPCAYRIQKVGIEFFDNAVAAQPLYKLLKKDWLVWLENIEKFCENQNRKCYAENAFNEVSDRCMIKALDVKDALCCEIDTPEDRERVISQLS